MAKNYVADGNVLKYTAGANIASGALVLMNTIAGVAVTDIANGESGSVQISGIFTLAKASGAINQGAKVYWDATNSNVTTTASGNTLIGVAATGVISGATTVDILLNVSNG